MNGLPMNSAFTFGSQFPKQDINPPSIPAPCGFTWNSLPPGRSEKISLKVPELTERKPENEKEVFTERKPENEQEVSKKLNDIEKDKDEAAEHNLHNEYDIKIRPCIDLVESLRRLDIGNKLMLPMITVIGDQNSGKSSVLEALSGVALPRRNGVITRGPLELKLKKITTLEEWKGVIYYHDTEIQLQDASAVKKAITEAQDIVASTSGNISGELISLEIWSPNVPDLTLIDLPGIARVAAGNQPQDNDQQIKKLLKKYIGCKETIILVVVPCNVDIATTEALKMAQEVDPTGERTLGILTKPDLVDHRTEGTVLRIMQNEVVPLRKGYMIVKCHGQQDVNNKLSLASVIQQEREFFETHKHFSIFLDEKKATISQLANKLTNELVEHTMKTLPAIENQILDALQQAKQELQKYTQGIHKTDHEKMLFFAGLIKAFNEDISQAMHGKESWFGNETRLFPKIRGEFQRWEAELLESSAKGMVEEKFLQLANKHFGYFQNLNKAAKARICCIREKQATAAKNCIQTQFKIERAVYCQDKIYANDLKVAKAESINALGFRHASNQGPSFVLEMISHTKAYFTGASKRLSNQIPLIILSTVLHDYGDSLQISMLNLLQGKEELNHLLQEDQEAAHHRKLLTEQISHLNKAHQYLVDFKSL
uniref:MX dynamin like GTPase 2 n=1 Tax=Coturnix japonica TaxID=93934 RepID=A0A8C2T835_COTJA